MKSLVRSCFIIRTMCKQMDISCPPSQVKRERLKEMQWYCKNWISVENWMANKSESYLNQGFILFLLLLISRHLFQFLSSTANRNFSKLEWFEVKPFQCIFKGRMWCDSRSKPNSKERVQLSFITVNISNNIIESCEFVLV